MRSDLSPAWGAVIFRASVVEVGAIASIPLYVTSRDRVGDVRRRRPDPALGRRCRMSAIADGHQLDRERSRAAPVPGSRSVPLGMECREGGPPAAD
jgi:hypothetical protein